MPVRRVFAVLAAVAAGVTCGACARTPTASAPLSASAVGASTRVDIQQRPAEDEQVFVRMDNVVRLPAVINGVVAFQIVLSAEQGPSVGVELTAEDFRGPAGIIPRQAVALYRQWPITINRYPNWYLRSQGPRRPRDVLDVLVPVDAPRGGQPFVIPPGSRLPIWVEIRIPADARPGTYQGGVNARDADGKVLRTPVELVVRDVYLSPKDALPVLARVQLAPIISAQTRFDPQNIKLAVADEEARRILTQAFVVLQEHGLSPYTDDVRPLASRAADGSIEFDWSNYDAFCGPLIDGTAYGGIWREPPPEAGIRRAETEIVHEEPTSRPSAADPTSAPGEMPVRVLPTQAPASAESGGTPVGAPASSTASESARIEVFVPASRPAEPPAWVNPFFDAFPADGGSAGPETTVPDSGVEQAGDQPQNQKQEQLASDPVAQTTEPRAGGAEEEQRARDGIDVRVRLNGLDMSLFPDLFGLEEQAIGGEPGYAQASQPTTAPASASAAAPVGAAAAPEGPVVRELPPEHLEISLPTLPQKEETAPEGPTQASKSLPQGPSPQPSPWKGEGAIEMDSKLIDSKRDISMPPPVFSVDESPFAGRPAHAWPLPVDLTQPDAAQYGGLQTTVFAAVLKEYLTQARNHFAEKGWLGRAFVYFDLPATPNPQTTNLEEVRQLAWLTHLVDKGLAFMSKLIPQPMAPFGWFEHSYEDLTADIDIWATPARYEHPPTLQRLQALGKRTWLSPDRPPFSGSIAVEAPPVEARSLPWQAFLQGHDALYLPYATNWPEKLLDRPIEDRTQPSDGWLLYPGTSFGLMEPVPSLRLKQLQLGIQDYQLLRLLEAKGRGETAKLLAGSLIKAAGTDACGDNYQDGLFGRRVDDPRAWEMAQRLLVEEAAAALLEDSQTAADRLALQALWAEFLSATRRIEARTEAARLVPDERAGRGGYLIKYEAAIRNELRTPLAGELTFDQLPQGVERVSDFVRLGPIPEMGMARGQLVVAAPVLPQTDLDGHSPQTIVFDAGTSGSVRTEATLSIVIAPEAPNPITIDGDLSDWPPNEFNIAGDFRLITAGAAETDGSADGGREEPSNGGGSSRRRAESQTVAYFCRDAGRLCIAVHAASPATTESDASAQGLPLRNFVEYEDLMPIGEDLVEILLNPTNAATQSDDLYHIVLKSTGIPVFERGIGTVPPIGRCRSWPSISPTCCVRPTSYGWCAELAIPLSTFGAEAQKSTVWGLNLARLEPVRGEYSDWARAPRYCYDPRTLGNLVWP